MSWITEHARVWRIAALIFLVAAIIGPWVYDQINVPAEYPCSAPFVRLEGDFCGVPMSGAYMLFALVGESVRIVSGLVTGGLLLAETSRQLLILLLGYLLLLPAFSTLLMILKGDRRWLQIFHITVLCLAGGLMLWVLSAESGLHTSQLWGPWLYLASVMVLLILEIIVFAFKSRLRPVS
jgi:hypothetical protein